MAADRLLASVPVAAFAALLVPGLAVGDQARCLGKLCAGLAVGVAAYRAAWVLMGG